MTAPLVARGQHAVVGSVVQLVDGSPSTMLVTTGWMKIGSGLLVTPSALAEMYAVPDLLVGLQTV